MRRSVSMAFAPALARALARALERALAPALALALGMGVGTAGMSTASAQVTQSPSPCNGFIPLRNDAQRKGRAIGLGEQRHIDRKGLCTLVSTFYVAEARALKYLETNKTWCGIPEQAIVAAKETHEKTMKFRQAVCAAAPQPHIPTLSDAIGVPELDTAKNTKTGNGGTFDTLTGNPLAR